VKRAFLVIALLLATALPAAAQNGTTFGVRVGINFANLSIDPEDEEFETKTKTGLVAGGFATIPLNARFAFQPEVLFSMQGASVEEFGEEGSIKLDYLNVPLLASIRLTTGENPVSFLVGPQIGFRTSGKAVFAGEEEDLEDVLESTDWALVFGVAANIRNFVIDARYNHGLSNINKVEVQGLDDDDEGSVKNRVFAISFGVTFR